MAVQLRYWFIALLTLVTLQTEAQVWLKQLEPSETGAEYRIKTYSSNGRQHYYLPYDTAYLIPADTLGIVIDSVLYKVKLPGNLIDTAWWSGDTLYIDDDTIHLAVPLGFDTAYIDAPDSLILFLDGKRVGLKLPPDTGTDSQILTYDYAGIYDTISISNGNSIYLVDSFNLVDTAYIHGDTLYILDDTLSFAIPLDTVSTADFWRDQDGKLPGDLSDSIYRIKPVAIGVDSFAGVLNIIGNIGTFGGANNFAWGGIGQTFESISGNNNIGIGFQSGYNLTTGNNNTNMGYQAGYSLTTGVQNNNYGSNSGYGAISASYNNNFGYQAGYGLTYGDNNNNFGREAGYGLIGGYYNNNFGYRAGYNSVAGQYLNNFGYLAGYNNTGTYNNNFGREAGYAGSGGNNNNFGRYSGSSVVSNTSHNNNNFGQYSGYNLTTGNNNTNMGYQAGYSLTTHRYVVAIGYQAAYSNAFENIAVIGKTAEADAANQFSVSNTYTTAKLRNYKLNIDQDTTGLQDYFLGLNRPSGEIELQSLADVEAKPQTIDTFDLVGHLVRLSLDRDGEAYHSITLPIDTVADHDWHTATGATPWSINDNIHTKGKIAINDGYKSIWIGVDSAGYNSTSTGQHNLMMLDSAGWSNTTGHNNIFIGDHAGFSNEAGYRNVILGDSVAATSGDIFYSQLIGTGAGALRGYISGSVTIGDYAGYSGDTLLFNTFIGYNSGRTAYGTANTFVGAETGNGMAGIANTVVGYYAASAAVSGDGNAFFGESAGEQNTGDDNTYVGSGAGQNVASGGGNVAIGAGSMNDAVSGTRNIAIGHFAMDQSTGGTDNIIMGYQAGRNISGNANIFMGFNAGIANTSGSHNIFLGYLTGDANTTYSNNIAIGQGAGAIINSDWNLFIGQGNSTSAPIWGYIDPFGTDSLRFNTQWVAITEYPNTRDDAVTPVNFLGTDDAGQFQSFTLDTVIAVMQRNISAGAMNHFYWDSGNDGGAGVEITDGETITITGSNGITTSPSGNIIYIDGTSLQWYVSDGFTSELVNNETIEFVGGTGISTSYNAITNQMTITNTASSSYTDWQLNVNGSFADYITDGEILGFSAGSGISLSYVSGTTVQITATDASTTNELQTLTSSGTTSFTSTLSDGGGSLTLSAGTGISISRSGNTATITNTSSASNDLVWNEASGDANDDTSPIFRSGTVSVGAINDDFVDGGTAEPVFHVYSSSGSRTINSEFFNQATNMRINLRNSSYTNYLESNGSAVTLAASGNINLSTTNAYVTSSSFTTNLNITNSTGTGKIQEYSGEMRLYSGSSTGAVTMYGKSSGGTPYITANGNLNEIYLVTSSYAINQQAIGVGIARNASANRLEVQGDASKTTAGSWLANSDRRIKKDISDVEDAYAIIQRLRPVTFRYTDEWRERNPSIQDHPYYNYIAQEYQKIFPDDVKGSGEYLPGDPDEILQIDDHAAQIVTTAAVKQLILDYKALTKRVEELENQLRKDGKN